MKTGILILISAIIVVCINACTKESIGQLSVMHLSPEQDSTLKTQALLLGNWNVVSDTTYAGVNTGGNPRVYVGQPGDYFDFANNGHVYMKEGNVLDTLNYQLISGKQVDITSFTALFKNQIETCQIPVISAHRAAIVSPLLTPPAGPQQRIVNLSR